MNYPKCNCNLRAKSGIINGRQRYICTPYEVRVSVKVVDVITL